MDTFKMPRTYVEYLSLKNYQCKMSRSFRFSMYQLIEKADLANRRRLSVVFPDEVQEVMNYEGQTKND